jgi:2-C-methyl-D-erythritol 2,4-cyclodiphosphate synthase
MSEFRTGLGYDLHAVAEGRKLILGGVEIPHDRGLAGHSDADVVAHAVTDALLGAAALGDIGEHFPASEPRWKDASSLLFLEHARRLLEQHGFTIVNLDVVVVIERPKILPHRARIRESLARALGLDAGAVSVKAKTAEGLGPVGLGLAAEAHAIATIRRTVKEPAAPP